MRRSNYFYMIFFFLLLICNVLACPDYLKKYPLECKLSDDYSNLKEKFAKKRNINIEYLTGYRALRFIEEKKWKDEQGKIKCRPWKAYLPSPDVWSKWEKSAHYLHEVLIDEKLKNKRPKISLPKIKNINIMAVDVKIMGVIATQLKGALPGRIRTSSWGVPGFNFSCSSGYAAEAKKLFNKYDIVDNKGTALVSTPAMLPCPDGIHYQGVVSYMATSGVKKELGKLINFANRKVNEFLNSKQPADYSPLDFIADFQRWFVAIHPFGDGNGRTSRFLQDYLLAKFGLPYAPSGRLQNDVLIPKNKYRDLFKKSLKDSVGSLQKCDEEHNSLIDKENYESLSCDCRPMYQEENPLAVSSSFAYTKDKIDPKCKSGLEIPDVEAVQDFSFRLKWAIQNTALID